MSKDSRTRVVAELCAAWVVLAGVVLAWGWLLTHRLTDSVGRIDDDLAGWFSERRTPILNDLADSGSLLGDTVICLGAALVLATGFAIRQRSVGPALFVVVVGAGIQGIYLLAVTIDHRQRPPVEILDPGLVPNHSFPSGHVGTAIMLYGCAVVLTWTYARAARWWVMPLVLLPVVVLTARLYQGAHHLSDVLTSVVFATVWLAIVSRPLRSATSRRLGL